MLNNSTQVKLQKQFVFVISINVCTGDPEKQGDLIKQLQEQHYIQYMQQLQAAQRDPFDNKNESSKNVDIVSIPVISVLCKPHREHISFKAHFLCLLHLN